MDFTPTSSSWLNLVERWFGELTSKLLKRGGRRSVRALNADIRAWIETWNDDPRLFVWTKTADEILDAIARYCSMWVAGPLSKSMISRHAVSRAPRALSRSRRRPSGRSGRS